MATSGPLYPATMTESGAGNAWTSPEKAAGAPDADGASLTLDGLSKRLQAGPDGLGFAIPAAARIDGILLTVIAKGGTGA